MPPGTQESMGEVSHAFRQEVSALEAQLAEDPLDTTSLLRLGDLLLAATRRKGPWSCTSV